MAGKRGTIVSRTSVAKRVSIAKGDRVIVLSGTDKGKTGEVLEVLPKDGLVVVEKIRLVKRHAKAGRFGLQQGGIIEKEAPIHACKVALVDKKGNGTRLRRSGAGRSKTRVASTTGEIFDRRKE